MRAGLRLLFLLLIAAGLGSCTLLHPRRITNPPLPAGYKAQQKAARQARKNVAKAAKDEAKTRRKKDQNPDKEANSTTDVLPGAAPTNAPAPDALAQTQASRNLPDKSGVKYDKHELLKKPKLRRRHYYRSAPKPFRPLQRISSFFRNLTHPRHGKSKSAPRPAPEPAAAPEPVDTGLKP